MPYVRIERKKALDPLIQSLAEQVTNPGDMAYVVTRLMVAQTPPEPRYADLCTVYGNILLTAQEFWRRVVAPYENKKWLENGDGF